MDNRSFTHHLSNSGVLFRPHHNFGPPYLLHRANTRQDGVFDHPEYQLAEQDARGADRFGGE